MTTTLESSFLQAALLINSFKHKPMVLVQGALLHMALQGRDFTAAELPSEVTQGSKNIAGAATGALIAQGMLVVVGRVKSPQASAKGRKLDLLRLAPSKKSTAETWLRANGLPMPHPGEQLGLAI